MNTVIIRLMVTVFNITIIQVYAPTSDNDDDAVDDFYDHQPKVVNQSPRKAFLLCLANGMPK